MIVCERCGAKSPIEYYSDDDDCPYAELCWDCVELYSPGMWASPEDDE